jgi:hypothetical protein
MDFQYILLFSNYSNACFSVITSLKHTQHSLPISYINIDGTQTRQHLTNANAIKKVPTLLEYNGTKMNVYEGERCVKWINEFFQSQKRPIPTTVPSTEDDDNDTLGGGMHIPRDRNPMSKPVIVQPSVVTKNKVDVNSIMEEARIHQEDGSEKKGMREQKKEEEEEEEEYDPKSELKNVR